MASGGVTAMASGALAKSAFSASGEEDQALPVSKGNSHRGFLIFQALARVLAIATSFIALALMVNSRETVYIFGITFDASYSYASAFRFLMVVDAVVGSLSAVSLGALCLIGRSPSARRCFYLFAHDLVVMLVMMSGSSAATAVGFVGKYGEEKMGWMPLCDRITKFCTRVMISIAFSYVAMFCFVALTLSSASKLMSRLPH